MFFIVIVLLIASCGSDVPYEVEADEVSTVITTTVIAITTTLPAVTAATAAATTELVQEEPPLLPPDYIANVRSVVNTDFDEFYIGMSDLKNPGSYRHTDNSAGVHPGCTIKVFIMEYVFLHEDNLDIDINGMKLSERIKLMIQESCNYSTDAILKHFGRRNIRAWILENYYNTYLNSDFLGNEYEGYNATTVEDNIIFLEKLFNNKDIEPYNTMYEIMLGTTFTRNKIPEGVRGIEGVKVANKTGSFYWRQTKAVDNDIAIVTEYNEDGELILAYALVIFTNSTRASDFSAARPSIVGVSREIYNQVNEYETSNSTNG